VLSNTIVGNGGAAMRVQGDVPLQIAGNNLEGNKGSFDLYLDMPNSITVTATNNWWGVTSTTAIRSRVFDWRRDSTKALAVFSPTLTGPVLDAPAYVRRVAASPDTVGIEPVTFSVELSKDMLPEPLPLLTVAGPGYAETITGTWTTSTTASFATEVTSLWPRGRYTATVSSAVGTDGIEIAPNSDYSFTVDYAGSVTDQSPPTTPQVTARADGSLSQLTLRWVTSDAESAVTTLRYAVGTTPGGTDVVNWTTVAAPSARADANAFTIVRRGLRLLPGQVYFVSAQARNASGLWSASGLSNPVGGVDIYVPFARR
jgi:hypothetical protein